MTVYLKTHHRMPLRLLSPVHPRDIQQDIPAGWCLHCRRELYRPGLLCPRCEGVCKNADPNR